jgi:hypothetical protein
MEVYVFLNKSDLPAVEDWQRSIQNADFPIDLHAAFNPTKDSGFVPSKLRGKETGFEYLCSPAEEVASAYPDLKGADRLFDSVAIFSWGARMDECAVALVAASTLAASTSGIMFDPQEGRQYDGHGALKVARETYEQILAAIDGP